MKEGILKKSRPEVNEGLPTSSVPNNKPQAKYSVKFDQGVNIGNGEHRKPIRKKRPQKKKQQSCCEMLKNMCNKKKRKKNDSQLSSYKVLRLSLKLSEPKVQLAFKEYLCKLAQARGCILFAALSIFLIILLVFVSTLSLTGGDFMALNICKLLLFGHSLPTLVIAITLLVAQHYKKALEFMGSAVYFAFVLNTFLLIYGVVFPFQMTLQTRTIVMQLISLYYFAAASLFQVHYLYDLPIRLVCFCSVATAVIVQSAEADETNLGAAIGLAFIYVAITESILYTNSFNLAQLFLTKKVNKMQQGQLLNLMDTVSDKVMLCQPIQDSRKQSIIHYNGHISNFFCNKLQIEAENEWSTTMDKKSFREMSSNFPSNHFGSDNAQVDARDINIRMSLSEILRRHQRRKIPDLRLSFKRFEHTVIEKKYLNDTDEQDNKVVKVKMLEIKLIDFVYDHQVCSLLYMRDSEDHVKTNKRQLLVDSLLTHNVSSQPSKIIDIIKENLSKSYNGDDLGSEMNSSLEFLRLSINSFSTAYKSLKMKQITGVIGTTIKRFDIRGLIEATASSFSLKEAIEKGIEVEMDMKRFAVKEAIGKSFALRRILKGCLRQILTRAQANKKIILQCNANDQNREGPLFWLNIDLNWTNDYEQAADLSCSREMLQNFSQSNDENLFEDQISQLEAVGGKLTYTFDSSANECKTTVTFPLENAPQLLYFNEEDSN